MSRKILITGGGSGIGRAAAHLFARQGARVAILDRDQAAAAAVAKSTSGFSVQADVLSEAEVNRAVDEAARALGGIDGLINAAGVASTLSVEETDFVTWQRVIGINLTGTFIVIRAALPLLKKARQATIVNISSGEGLLPSPHGPAYAASKAGLLGLTKELAGELAPTIRVNAACPGIVDTPMASEGLKNLSAEKRAFMLGRYALQRIATADEIASALLFLTSDESSFMTGVSMAIDGGLTFH